MFNKLKQLKDLRSHAKTMQAMLAGETVEAEKNGLKITMNGNMEVTSVSITEDLSREKMEESIKICVNDAVKKTQRVMAQKMQEMGGIPGLS